LLPWTHGHQVKSIATFVAAIIEKQTGNQAELARTQGNLTGFAGGRSNGCRLPAKSESPSTGRSKMIGTYWPSH